MKTDNINLKIISDNDLIKIAHAIWPEISRKLKLEFKFKIIKKYLVTPLCIAKKNEKQDNGFFYVASTGCSHQLNGGCTMCSYIVQDKTNANTKKEELKKSFSKAIKYLLKINEGKSLYTYNFSTGGSFFDPFEVPPSVRRYVYRKIKQIHPTKIQAIFGCETRLEYINVDVLNEFKKYMGDNVKLLVMYGIESTNALVRECCINKRLPDNYREKIKLLKEYGADIQTNVMVKPIFLTEKEAIEDVVNSVFTVLGEELANSVVIMTMGLRESTITYKLYNENKYQFPSIWSVIAIIKKLGPDICKFTSFNGFAYYPNQYNAKKHRWCAWGCSECSPLLIPKLLSFKRPTKKEWYELIDISQKINCKCKKEWLRRMEQVEQLPLKEKIIKKLNDLCFDMLGKELNYFIKKKQQIITKK